MGYQVVQDATGKIYIVFNGEVAIEKSDLPNDMVSTPIKIDTTITENGSMIEQGHFEVELKFPVENFNEIENRFHSFSPPALEIDTYYRHPSKDMLAHDQWLRVRKIGVRYHVTFKGPLDKDPTHQFTKTRQEIELAIKTGNPQELFAVLGFKPLVIVEKHRRTHKISWNASGKYDPAACRGVLSVTLDEVKELGSFIEIEVVTSSKYKDEASKAIQQLAQSLGLEKSERRGYAQLLLQQKNFDFCYGGKNDSK